MNKVTAGKCLAALSLLTLCACGFTPIYATPDGGGNLVNQEIEVASVSAPEELHLFVVEALRARMSPADGVRPKYELSVVADESARPLAVQIDATVTRYNYRLSGRYRLRNLETREVTTGSAVAVTSYNIVSSQYSTLYAERTAREKASLLLAQKIEQDIILRMNDSEVNAAKVPGELDDEPDEIGNITQSDRDGTPAPFIIQEEDPTDDDAPILIDERP